MPPACLRLLDKFVGGHDADELSKAERLVRRSVSYRDHVRHGCIPGAMPMSARNKSVADAVFSGEMARSFEELLLPLLDAAFNYARWLTKNDADAEDVVQDACDQHTVKPWFLGKLGLG